MLIRNALLIIALLTTACATSPLDTTGVATRATPSQVVGAFPEYRGVRVEWGGQIVSITNKEQSTRVEMLSYPVARDGFPNNYRKHTGRFVLQYPGFLEPQDFTPGRTLTVVGTVDALIETTVGEARFVLPLISAEQLKLWPEGYGDHGQPTFGFGLGISFGF